VLAGRDGRLARLARSGGEVDPPGEVIGGCRVGAAGSCKVAAVHPRAAQVVDLPRNDGLGRDAEGLNYDPTQVAVGEGAGKDPELADPRNDLLAVSEVVAYFLDVQERPGG
jgi:hypothetical protein